MVNTESTESTEIAVVCVIIRVKGKEKQDIYLIILLKKVMYMNIILRFSYNFCLIYPSLVMTPIRWCQAACQGRVYVLVVE